MDQVINLNSIGWAGALVLVAWAMRPVWAALQDWVSRREYGEKESSGLEDRLYELEQFKTEAETNHFHDLEGVMGEVKELRRDFDDFRVGMERRLTRLESRVFNGNRIPKP